MKICISGIAGFIGSTLADRLLADGHEVWGIDNFATGRRENVPEGIHCFQADIQDGLGRQGIFGQKFWIGEANLIIHCAASYKNPDACRPDIGTNIYGAHEVALAAKEWNSRIFYFQTVLPPISSYAISKIAGEHYLRLSGQSLTVFRLAAVYGPRNLSGAIPTFYRQIKAGLPCTVVEDATRDFVFVDDLLERVLVEVNHPDPKERNHMMDVRTGSETRIRDIPGMIGEILGVEPTIKLIPRPPHDVPHYDMDGTPRIGTPFKEGLRKAVEWYQENAVGETYTHLGALSG